MISCRRLTTHDAVHASPFWTWAWVSIHFSHVDLCMQVRYHVLTEPEMKPLLDEINQQIQKEKDEES